MEIIVVHGKSDWIGAALTRYEPFSSPLKMEQ